MQISFSTYHSFWDNPARFCRESLHGLQPSVKPLYYQRGGWLHSLVEQWFYGYDDAWLQARAIEDRMTDEGKALTMSLWPVYLQHLLNKPRPLVVETEFEWPIPDSPHSIIGRVDQICPSWDGMYVSELKTVGAGRWLPDVLRDLRYSVQPEFELIGARALGYDVRTVVYEAIQEEKPERKKRNGTIVPAVPVSMLGPFMDEGFRTNKQVDDLIRHAAMTGDIITMLVDKWGIDKSWPHGVNSWQCKSDDQSKCEFRDICNIVMSAGSVPDGFIQGKRKEVKYA